VWAILNGISVYGAVLLSGLTAALLTFSDVGRTVQIWGAAMSALAVALTTRNEIGKFQLKWLVDRNAWIAIDAVLAQHGESNDAQNK
jgi:hypothetical protein